MRAHGMSGRVAVAFRRTSYPQVDLRAGGLMERPLAVVPLDVTVSSAARAASRQRAPLVAVRVEGSWAAVSRETMIRALGLGLHRAPLAAILWDAPVVPSATSEVDVRRALGPDRPFLLVEGPRGPQGVVFRDPGSPAGLPMSVAPQLGQVPGRAGEILRAAGSHGDALGTPVAAVGGWVRDLLLGRVDERTDLDLVVEGSAPALARQLATSLGGQAVEHPVFLTATVVLPDGRRVDLASARRESYRTPGALPAVERASLTEDLARRDFSVNALAVRLDRTGWGRLVDTTGGLADLRARRIRVLHPLSFIEDPTRIFRAARFATRLGCRIDLTTRRLASRAALLDVYRALSGDRLRAELEILLSEHRPVPALLEAGELGAWSLVGATSVPGPAARRRLARALRSQALEGLGPDAAMGLTVLALAEGDAAIDTWTERLALAPSRRAAIRHAYRDAPTVVRRLTRLRGSGGAYGILQGVPELTLAWARVLAESGRPRVHLDRHLRRWRGMQTLASGDDVAALGVPAGPATGEILRALRAAQAAGKVRSRTGALRWLTGTVARSRARESTAHPTG
jgi:tRNA nucleotidyltransferase (CCA-adding enzyme)